ncbi:BMP family protein [Halococcus thailandensis]|nr:BMP family protein [Halococcus thailandensis]
MQRGRESSDDGPQQITRGAMPGAGCRLTVAMAHRLRCRSSETMTTTSTQLTVAMVLPGDVDDDGFVQAGDEALSTIEHELGAATRSIEGVASETESLATAIRDLATERPDLLIVHGGQGSAAAADVAPDHPDIAFVVTQGSVTGPNLASYVVLQEQSAFLAGAAAGLLTESDVVGHISGIRVPPGLKGRAAYAAGVAHTNPDATLLTTFAGDQDDADLARRVAEAQIERSADTIFTMLNTGRSGAITAADEHGIDLFGNVGTWYPDHPETFVGSAVADVGADAIAAARDFENGDWQADRIVEIGLEEPEAVRLSLAPDVPDDVRERVDALAERIVAGKLAVETDYDGPEFAPFDAE